MIILKQLKVERFRLLREIDLHFPPRGSVLIAGPNEAGKSALVESIYFALYGEPLAQQQGKRAAANVDDLVQYGEREASVTLTLSVGATEMTITRTLARGKKQEVALHVRKLGMPAGQPITDVTMANERILAEIGRLDAKTLRSSCLIEQKSLNRLENLGGREREAALHNLLGLERLSRLAEQFRLSGEDERALQDASKRLELAEVQARIPELSSTLGRLEEALDAVAVCEDLQIIQQQESEIAEQQVTQEQIEVRRLALKNRQQRIQQLRKAGAILDEIIQAYDTIAEAQRELPELEHQLSELERREKEELPALEQRVRDLIELTRSFGTLERMATDLLNAVNTIKELEQGFKQQERLKETLSDLDEQVEHTRQMLDEAQQAQHEAEEQNRQARPQLEQRLERLKTLAEKLRALKEAEEAAAKRSSQRAEAGANTARLEALRVELQKRGQELAQSEREAQQAQERADTVEKYWQQLNIRQQLTEWQRLRGLAQGMVEAEQQLEAGRARQQQWDLQRRKARNTTTTQMIIAIVCAAVVVLSVGGALYQFLHHSTIFAVVLGVLALAVGGFGGYILLNYNRTRQQEREADQKLQEASNSVSMMVAARETARRAGGNAQALAQIEHEIRAYGGSVPHTLDEAARLLQQMPAPGAGESLADIQKQMMQSRDQALAAHVPVKAKTDEVNTLRGEQTRLQEQRAREGWDDLPARLQADRQAIEKMRADIASLAGREGLPIPNFDVASSPDADLREKLEENMASTEREIALLDGKLSVLPALSAKTRMHQEALDALQARKQSIAGRIEQFEASSPMQQIERAREQQVALREALRALQDSLRLRVQPLGVSFGQTAITTAEISARKQLDALQVALGQKETLQKRREYQSTRLQETQESLAEHYRQLAKYSTSLGSWIVPLNPFADALHGLRARCDREIEEAGERGIGRELEDLKSQEGASKAKVALCQHEIEVARERIAAMLARRGRSAVRGFTLDEIAAVWPLLRDYTAQDRARLEEESVSVEHTLRDLEQQDLRLSQELGTGRTTIDLDQARQHMEQQERSYQTKERAGLLIAATFDRLMRQMLPRTEYYMQQLLPLLTRGRYRDARLATEQEEGISSGGPFQVSLWEPAANAYIPLADLSGGIADQVSLALRLAFTIAALPRELNAAPGFLILDEPLSITNRDRVQSLVDIVTGETLGQHFEQILFVSHNTLFDSSHFTYRVTFEGGQVAESTLPVEAEEPASTPGAISPEAPPVANSPETPLPSSLETASLAVES